MYFQTPTVFRKWESLLSVLNVHGINDNCQTRIHTAKITVSEPSTSEFEIKPPGTDQIPA
jgi:hypothetical protein